METQRILDAYEKRDSRPKGSFFGYEDPAHLFRGHERYQQTLILLKRYGFHPLSTLRILDVGCGNGNMLRQFLQWGARPEQVAGIELRPQPVQEALVLNPTLDIRCGSATELPWESNSFDLVCQHTVFTSILDANMKRQVAAEMERVLKPGGAVLWYDFRYNNPRNPNVQGVKAAEIQALFADFKTVLQSTTLAPPIARKLPQALLPVFYPLLSAFPFLRTHYLGLLIKPTTPPSTPGEAG